MDPLSHTVAKRWVKSAASIYWTNADPWNLNEYKSVLREDLQRFARITKMLTWWSSLFRSLAGPLMAPKLNFFADWSDRFLSDSKELYDQLEATVPLADRAQKELEELASKWGTEEEEPHRSGLIETLYELPSATALYKLARKLEPLQKSLDDRAEDPPIDWFLEDYVGGESGVSKRLQKFHNTPTGIFSEEMLGILTLTGFIQYVTSEEAFYELEAELHPDE